MTPKQLLKLRLTLNLTVEEIAKAIGVSARMYYYAEKGEKNLGKASIILAKQLKERL